MSEPKGWRKVCYGDIMVEIHERAGMQSLPVLSVTKSRGPMLASERFGRALYSRKNLANYRLAPRNHIACDPMLLWDGSIGRQDVVDLGVVSPDYRVYQPRDGVDAAFLGFLVRSPPMKQRYASGARGTNVRRNRISRSDFLAIQTVLPPIPEQRKIAAILAAADELIEQTEAVIEQLQVVKKAMMQELLTRGLPGRHTRFKKTEIGEIPESWTLVDLGAITEASAFGPRFPASLYSESGNYGTLRTTDITDEWEINYETIPRADLSVEKFEKHLLQNGDLLITRSGTCGVICVFDEQALPTVPGAFLIRFRLRQGISPHFVRFALMLDSAQRRIGAMAAGGVQKNLSGTNLRTLLIPLPPAAEQRGIVEILTSAQTCIKEQSRYLRDLHELKRALMSVLLTGEVRVTPDEAPP